MSIVSYNGVTLPYSNMTSFDASPVFDDVGQVDHCLTRYTIGVQCYITGDYLAMYANSNLTVAEAAFDPNARNPAAIMQLIQARLEQPRQRLSYTFNGVELIPQRQGAEQIQQGIATGVIGQGDARNGPQTGVQVIRLTNESFLLRFNVVGHYWRRNITQVADGALSNRNGTGSAVIYNRWTETVDFDASMYATRMRQGRYQIRSDNAEGLTADEFREGFACCSLPRGFVRVKSQYDLSPDGLGLQYRIVDQEVYKQPPTPAFEARGRYIDMTTQTGAWRYGEVNLYLRAPKSVDQVLLINIALGICAKKLIISGALGADGVNPIDKGNDNWSKLDHCVISVDMYDNAVEVSMRALMANLTIEKSPALRKWGIAGLRGGEALAVTPYPNGVNGVNLTSTGQPRYLTRGTSNLLLQAAAYYDPSLATQINELRTGKMDTPNGTEVTLSTDAQIADRVNTGFPANRVLPGQVGTKEEPQRN